MLNTAAFAFMDDVNMIQSPIHMGDDVQTLHELFITSGIPQGIEAWCEKTCLSYESIQAACIITNFGDIKQSEAASKHS